MRYTERPNEADHKDGPVVFGIAGQIIERKGHHLAFDAMAKVRKRLPGSSFRLKVYGDGDESYIAKLKAQSISLGVDDLVEWCGYCDNSDDYYQGIDCALVMTTTPDPCPLAAIEPGAYAIPAITSTSGGLAELVLDGKTGFLVPPNDVDALADSMVTMISDDENRRHMGVCAFWENKRRFDEPIVVDQVAAILTKVARDVKSQSAQVF
jgi:glycosyltransferase involved in cell wall biosynthesis